MHLQQTGEYATDEEDAGTAVDGGDKRIEVFDLPESEDILSPSELDATKLYQKFREVMLTCGNQGTSKRNPQKRILPQEKKKTIIQLKQPHNQAALLLVPFLLRSKAGSPALNPD